MPKRLRADTPEWLEVWAIARYDLGLTEDEFWNLSIDEFNALLKRHNLKQEREDSRAAMICTVIANIFRGKGKPYKITDFMPSKPRQKRNQTPVEMVEMLKCFTSLRDKNG